MMLIHKYQRPHGLVAEVSIVGHLPEGHEASVEVSVPGIGVYWEILKDEEQIIANGFESSPRKAYLAIYIAAQAL
jgi:hypothetical protein